MLDYNIRILSHIRRGVETYRSIFLRLSFNGERKDISLNVSVDEKSFDPDKGVVVKHAKAKELNNKINDNVQVIKDIFNRYEYVLKKVPTLNMVVGEYKKTTGKEKRCTDSVTDNIDVFIKEQTAERGWSKSTKNMFNTLKRNLTKYNEEKKLTIHYADIDDNYLNAFCVWLYEEEKQQNVSVNKMARCARWYLRWAHKKGYYSGTSHDTFKISLKGGNGEYKTIVYLTTDEINKLKEFKGATYLETARDIFLFSCFCGLRYGDVRDLKKENIYDGSINIITNKTTDRLSIDLNKNTRAILDKYKDYDNGRGSALPVASNQKLNKYIKEVCKLCEIDAPVELVSFVGSERKTVVVPKYEAVTFHCSRKTFITHALRLGMPVPVIMKFSGHKSMNMLKPYMKIADELKAQEMAKFDNM